MTKGRRPTQTEDAIKWLQALLADAPKSYGEIKAAYQKDCLNRFSWRTLEGCKKEAGIASLAESTRWIWGREDVIKQMRGVVPAPRKKKVAPTTAHAPVPVSSAQNPPPVAKARQPHEWPLITLGDLVNFVKEFWDRSVDDDVRDRFATAMDKYREHIKACDVKKLFEILEWLVEIEPSEAKEYLLEIARSEFGVKDKKNKAGNEGNEGKDAADFF